MKKSLVKVMAVSSAALLLGGTYTLVINAEETNTPTEETTNPTEENPGSADSTPSEEPTETIPETTEEETIEEVEEFATPAEPADSAEPTPSEEPAETTPETVDEGTPEERIGNILVFRRDLDGKIHHLSDELNAETEISVTHADEELHVTQNNNWFTVPHKTDSNQGNEYEYAVKLPSGYRVVTDDVISPLGSRVVMDDISLTAGYPTYARQLRSDVGEFLLFNGKHTFFIAIEDATIETTEEETLEAPKEPATPEERIGNILVFRRDLDGKTHYLSDELNANTEISVSHDDEELHVTQNNNQFTIHHKTDSNLGNEYGYAVTLPVGYRVVTENVTLTVPFPNRNYAGQLKSGEGEFSLRSGWQTFSIVIEDATVEKGSAPGETLPGTDDLTSLKDDVIDVNDETRTGKVVVYVRDINGRIHRANNDLIAETGILVSQETPDKQTLELEVENEIANWFSFTDNTDSQHGHDYGYKIETPEGYRVASDDITLPPSLATYAKQLKAGVGELELVDGTQTYFIVLDYGKDEEGPAPGETVPSHDDETKLADDIIEVVVESADGEDSSYDDLTEPGDDITDVVVDDGSEPGETTPDYDDLTKLADDVIDVQDETRTGKVVVYVRDINGRIHRANNTLIADIGIHVSHKSENEKALKVENEVDNWFSFTDNTDSQHGHDYGYEIGTPEGYRVASDDIRLSAPYATYANQLKAGVGELQLVDGIQSYFIVLDHGKDEEGPKPGETTPSYDDLTKPGGDITDVVVDEGSEPGETVPGYDDLTEPGNDITDVVVEEGSEPGETTPSYDDLTTPSDDVIDVQDETRTGKVVVYVRDINGRIHRANNDLIAETGVYVYHKSENEKALKVENEVDNWFSFTDNTDSQHGHDYGYAIETPEGYRVSSDDITLSAPYATYAKQLKAGVGEFPLVDGVQSYFIVLDHGKDEEGSEPGETVPGYADLTEPGNDITDVVVEEGSEPGVTTPSHDDLTEPSDGITDVVVVVEEGPEPGETVPGHDDNTKLADDIIDIFTQEGPKPGETVPGADEETIANPENKVGRTDTLVLDENRTGKVVVYVRDINGRIHRANNDLIAELDIHVSQETPDKQTLELDVVNEVDNWFSFTDNTDSQYDHDYGYEIGTPEGYRVASDDITLPPSLATYAKQLKAGVGQFPLVDGTQTYFIVLDHGKDEEGPKSGETVPGADEETRTNPENKVGRTDTLVLDENRTGKVVVYVRDINGRIHRANNDLIAEIEIHVSQETPDRQTIELDVVNEVDNWFSFTDNTDSQHGHDYGYEIGTPEGYRVASDDITLPPSLATYAKQLKAGVGQFPLDDGIQTYFIVLDHGKDEEGPKPGETVPGADEATRTNPENKVGRTDTLVLDETRTGKVVVYVRDINGRIHRANNDLIAELDIHVSQETPDRQTIELDVVNEVDNWFSFTDKTDSQYSRDYRYEIETPEGYRVASDDITLSEPYATYAKQLKASVGELQLVDGIQSYFIVLDHGKDEEGPKPGETTPSYDDLTKLGKDITDVVVDEGSKSGETTPGYDDLTKPGDDLTDVVLVVEEGPEPGEKVSSYDDKTKPADDIIDVITEEGSAPGETTPSYDDKTKLADDVIDVITEEGPKPGETVPSHDDKTKLADDVIDVVIDEESKTDEETAKTSEDSTEKSTDEKLPETGEVSSTAIFSAAALSILAGLGLVAPVSKKED